MLMRELLALAEVDDAFAVEGVGSYVLDLVDVRGSASERALENFCGAAMADPRATTSLLGLQSVALIAALGPAVCRADAVRHGAAADPGLVAELPRWCANLGRVHLVEAASLRTSDGRETVLHLMLDYDDPAAGSRHLLTIACERTEQRVHLLDVRGRAPADSLTPMAQKYAASTEPVWSWIEATAIGDLVGGAVRTTVRHSDTAWPVVDVDGGATGAWTLGVRRLERLTGLDLAIR